MREAGDVREGKGSRIRERKGGRVSKGCERAEETQGEGGEEGA